MVPVVKNPSANAGDMRHGFYPWVREDPLDEGMTSHSSILAWGILCTEEPGLAMFHRVAKSQIQLK